MQQFREIFLVGAVLALTGCQAAGEVEDRLVTAFGETMFEAGPGAHGRGEMFAKGGTLAKWESPVTVAVVEGATAENVTAAKKRLAEMSELSGLAFEWKERGASGVELEIHFRSERKFIINGNEQAACFTGTAAPADGVLRKAEVHIGLVKDGEWRTDCLTHELLHALGWRGHTHRVRSAISYAHGETELTKWDRMLMRTLYDPRLEPGTSKKDALPTVRAILHEMIAD